ncbi:TetR/AcrR family transcriptional regulator [Cupriavidus necator]|uniref:TetR/AcrR family transcriptional regulator n=1 Tax=Cupriavidus necator TaxID=106590 RepID=A0A367PG33_CUPNE|nr:TetR/AcrR family transcriptional regulator [Cupriavidus necator]QQX86646.1 TetR/AcrR family transcriptional regulator [Cupriavidus necator]RCJ06838.1 TetR/AcrR family transcriptional regulator [Cupriavidus necator]
MARRSDSREQMIKAGRRLYSARGYLATAFSDVVAESGAPRGSVYFHFPGGKDEFASEVVAAHTRSALARVARLATTCSTPQELLVAYLKTARDHAVATDYQEGCPVGAVILEGAQASPELLASAGQAMASSIALLAGLLVERGAGEADAHRWATAAVTAFEGALIVSRALRDPSPFDSLIDSLRLSAA